MMASLFAGVSGLKNHQVKLNVIGNNIANVNTIGFKAGRVNFQEELVQTTKGAGRPSTVLGGFITVYSHKNWQLVYSLSGAFGQSRI